MIRPLVIWTTLGCSLAFAAEVTVSPGDDIRTLTASLGPGDEYIFEDGVYEIDNYIEWNGQGTEDQPIILRAAQGANPIIQLSTAGSQVAFINGASWIHISGLTFEGEDNFFEEASFYGVRIDNSSHITMENCAVRHVSATAIRLAGDASNNNNIRIAHNQISDTGSGHGIYLGCSNGSCATQNSTFDNNWIYDMGGDSYGIYIAFTSYDNTVTNNVIYNVGNDAIATHSTEFGDPNIIESNVMWNVGRYGMYISGSAQVRNNVVFNAGTHGLYSENNNGTLEKLVITSNTFADTGSYAVRLRQWAGTTGMVFANNALTNTTGNGFRADEGDLDDAVYIRNNAISGYVTGLDPEGDAFFPGGGSYDFVDAENWDFYPSRTSSLIDSGDAASEAWIPSHDFIGQPRDGNTPDVGAYEWVGTDNPGWAIQEGFKAFEDRTGGEQNSVGGCCKKDEASEASLILLFPLLGLGWGVRRRRS